MRAVLDIAGREIDLHPLDVAAAHRRALAMRHTIEPDVTELLDRLGRALGPRLRAFDALASQRISEVEFYVRQCHAERDLEALGTALRLAHSQQGTRPVIDRWRELVPTLSRTG